MTLKPMTYLVSFTLFVMLFMGLGGYVGYHKIADHLLAQAFLEATPLDVQFRSDREGTLMCWEETVAVKDGGFATISASNRPRPVSIALSLPGGHSASATPPTAVLPLQGNERTEDVRIDRAGRFLYVRVFASSDIPSKETTWLCRFDLQGRKPTRRIAVNPATLPPAFRPGPLPASQGAS